MSSTIDNGRRVLVYGAYGHTGRFVVQELLHRGWVPVLAGRDADKLGTLAVDFPGLESRAAAIDDAAALGRALAGTVAVINCAGPFLDTAPPILAAALRAGIHYLDVTAEQRSALDTYDRGADAAAAGITAIPAMGFYGGLSDLLATAALGDWTSVDAIEIAVALDSWHPTVGTRLTGQRNNLKRLLIEDGELRFVPDPLPTREWTFPAPFGRQETVMMTLSEIAALSRHVAAASVQCYINLAPLQDLRDPQTPPPVVDASGRSPQTFMVDVLVRKDGRTRRATAQGRDIYAVSAPLIVEAMERVVDGRGRAGGAFAPGQAFDARDFLASLSPQHLTLAIADA